MKYMLLVNHDEEAFSKFSEISREQCLRNLCKLMHQLHANGQYLSASPLHPASRTAIAQVPNQFMTDTCWNGRSPATD
jgi:hypothetical protein